MDLDPTKKIARQVGWLNKNAQLKNNISYSDVVSPLSQLDISEAMKILKDLEERAGQIENPTGYVNSAAARQLGVPASALPQNPNVGGRVTSAPSPRGQVMYAPPSQPALDPTGKISRQVGWLNRNANLVSHISFSSVVEPLSCIDVTEAMAILKEIEEKGSSVRDPTAYVLGAAQNSRSVRAPPRQQQQQQQYHVVQVPMQTLQMVPMQITLDPTGKIARQVGWLNKNANLREPISFSDVVEPLSQLDVTQAMTILKDLETAGNTINNPTGYVSAGAARAFHQQGGGGCAGRSAPIAQPMQHALPRGAQAMPPAGDLLDPSGKIYRQVGWLNKNVRFEVPLEFNDIAEPLSLIDIKKAMEILKELESGSDQVGNPNVYVLSQCSSNGASAGGGALDPTGKIGRQVGWLNKNVSLPEAICFSDVVTPLSNIDITAAMKILKEVEERAAQLDNPTSYVVEAAEEARANGSIPSMPHGGSGLSAGRGGGAVVVTHMPPRPNANKRQWQEEAAKPAEYDEESKQIARNVGRINREVVLTEKVSYSDVKTHLEECGLEAAIKILKDLEGSAGTIKNPTSYVIAAAKRACTGETIPAKRPRY